MIEVKAGQKVTFDAAAQLAQVRHGLPVLLFTRPAADAAEMYAPAFQKQVGRCVEWAVSEYDAAITGLAHVQIVVTGTETAIGDSIEVWVSG